MKSAAKYVKIHGTYNSLINSERSIVRVETGMKVFVRSQKDLDSNIYTKLRRTTITDKLFSRRYARNP